jgi:hypothetical protein
MTRAITINGTFQYDNKTGSIHVRSIAQVGFFENFVFLLPHQFCYFYLKSTLGLSFNIFH